MTSCSAVGAGGSTPCEIEGGPADRVGCVRVFPLAGGHREALVSLNDECRAIAFSFADNAAGLRVRRYQSTMSARPVTSANHTYVEWVSRFDCDESDEDTMITQVRDGVLAPGLKALEQTVRPVRPLHGCRGGHTRDRWGKVTRPGAVPRAS